MFAQSVARAGFGALVGLCLVAAAGCGGAGGGGGSGGGGAGKAAATANVPTKLPSGATLGCAEAPADSCVYGGAASAPAGLKAVNINTKISADMFKLQDPLTLVTDKAAPGGKYIALPTGTGGTSALGGDAAVAVTVPQDGYYVIWAGTQSGDTTTGTDSLFLGFDSTGPSADIDHVWSLNPDNTWHQNDSTGGCVQLVHAGKNDAPNGCDTWHFKKGVLVIHLSGREDDSRVAWLDVAPASAAKPLGDARG